MKLFRTLIYSTLALSSLMFSSCKTDEILEAKAVLSDQSILTFDAQNAAPQTITVYSDATWHVELPSWVTVDQEAGTGTTEVTIAVADNYVGGEMDEPRQDTVVFAGSTLRSRCLVIIKQLGDTYKTASKVNVSGLAQLADNAKVVLSQAQVVALATDGALISDGTAVAYALGLQSYQIGDNITLKGTKTSVNGMPAVTEAEEIVLVNNEEVAYPTAIDLTTEIPSYTASAMEYVTIKGEYASAATGGYNVVVTIDEVDYAAYVYKSTVDASGLNGHVVILNGYTVGTPGANTVNVVPVSIEDKGVKNLIYFEDDFEWIQPYSDASGAADSVGSDDAAGTSPNVYSSIPEFVTDFNNRGYDYYWGTKGSTEWRASDDANPKVLYINKNYLKFGKTSYNAGITLPVLSTIAESTSIKIEFDYCFQITGASVLDDMTLVVESNVGKFASTGGTVSEELATDQPKTESHLYWTHGSVILNGATAETVLKIHPACVDPYTSATTTKCNRWFLDNIKITPAEGGSGGADQTTVEFPIQWTIAVAENNYTVSWPLANGSATTKGTNGTIASTTGNGLIYYNNEAGNAADKVSGNKKTKLDINANCPRVQGAWPGDYCEFSAEGTIAKGAQVQISFETRTSATNPKYWELQYLDGTEWKTLGEAKEETVEGEVVKYTHAMNADGATNIQVKELAVYSNTTDGCVFRFVCKSAMGAGGTMLTAPNGGTWRLAVTDTSTDEWQPTLKLL